MNKHQVCLAPSPEIQDVVESGRGKALRITVSHSADSPQHIAFYDRQNNVLADYLVHPMQSPWTITYANRDSFSFSDGLRAFTGACTVILTLLY